MFDKALEEKFIDRMDQNHEIFAHYMNDKGFKRLISEWMRKQVAVTREWEVGAGEEVDPSRAKWRPGFGDHSPVCRIKVWQR